MTKQQMEADLSHSIMKAQLCLSKGVTAEAELALRASIQHAKRELQKLRASW